MADRVFLAASSRLLPRARWRSFLVTSPADAHTPPTIAYINRRISDGKSRREANRCLKRYLARSLYRLLEHPPATT